MAQADTQVAVFAFLANPATHGIAGPVTRIDTHIAAVFLAGPDVYKVKRAIRLPYLDFSTLERRRAACRAEITHNRVNAPMLYLGTVPITRERDGLHFGGRGPVVEWAVHMRRFDETQTLDRLAAIGAITPALIDALAGAIETAHRRALRQDGSTATTHLHDALSETIQELESRPPGSARATVDALRRDLPAAFARVHGLLLRRAGQGLARLCHGDLHLGNIALIDGRPVLFDAIEFDDAIATTDVLYDLAFVLMDLCSRDLQAAANRLLTRYLWLARDEPRQVQGLAVLPMALSLRAAIRAKVLIAQADIDPAKAAGLQARAAHYLQCAEGFLLPVPPRLIAVGGLSGSGKTTIAAALAPHLGAAPGACLFRSDIERKKRLGTGETTKLGQDAYDTAADEATYRRLRRLARLALGAGRSVIVDATLRSLRQRTQLRALAQDIGVRFDGIWLDAPAGLRAVRIGARIGDASDATPALALAQADPGPPSGWHRLDATLPAAEILAHALDALA